MATISVEDICSSMDMLAFTERFIDVLSELSLSQRGYPHSIQKQRIEEIRTLWNSPDQPIRLLYDVKKSMD
jgi:hypothetical protein